MADADWLVDICSKPHVTYSGWKDEILDSPASRISGSTNQKDLGKTWSGT